MAHVHETLAAGSVLPFSLLGTATHDTKRGEDARARPLHAQRGARPLGRGGGAVAGHAFGLVRHLDDGPAPEPTMEWLLYQSLAGIWPSAVSTLDGAAAKSLSERFAAYVEKALREAKQRTSWSEVDEAYEEAVKAYAAALLAPDNARFHEDFARTLKPFAAAGLVNALAQTLIKMTAPACRTSTKARRRRISAWSIPTTGGRSISPAWRCSCRQRTAQWPKPICPAVRPSRR